MNLLDTLTTAQIVALLMVFLMVGIPLLSIGFKALGEWLYEKMRRWSLWE